MGRQERRKKQRSGKERRQAIRGAGYSLLENWYLWEVRQVVWAPWIISLMHKEKKTQFLNDWANWWKILNIDYIYVILYDKLGRFFLITPVESSVALKLWMFQLIFNQSFLFKVSYLWIWPPVSQLFMTSLLYIHRFWCHYSLDNVEKLFT